MKLTRNSLKKKEKGKKAEFQAGAPCVLPNRHEEAGTKPKGSQEMR